MKEQFESIKKSNLMSTTSFVHQQSFYQPNFEAELDIAVLFSEPLYDEEKKRATLPAVDFRS